MRLPGWALLAVALLSAARADWPMLRGSPEHTGFVPDTLPRNLNLAWAIEFEGERLGTAVEPIIAGERLFVGTHAGNLYALEAESGDPAWRFEVPGSFLNSPAVAEELVLAGSTDGYLYALDAEDGGLRWRYFGGPGGFSAAPVPSGRSVFIGTRSGEFLSLEIQSGKVRWRQAMPAPIRQSAAVSGERVFVTAEDLRVRAFDAASGTALWTSEQVPGQTARDYYPVVVRAGEREWVVVRTNPVLGMAQRIGRDRTMLCQNAGVDDSGWQKVDAWIKSEAAKGTPELWKKEQEAIKRYLEETPDARTFHVLDGKTGEMGGHAPVLWVAGCQAVGAQPALTRDGQLLVFYRSAYGNWNHGVAPLVSLGLLGIMDAQITPLQHQQGRKPAWNCFWGTADESQNFLVAGDTILIVHQGTLSGFDLAKEELFPIHGERDTFGGFRTPMWARNEWHGPGRSGVAIADGRVYWQTGSRILCLSQDAQTDAKGVRRLSAADFKRSQAPEVAASGEELGKRMEKQVRELLERRWAPFFLEPGLAGRDFSFQESREVFEALSAAYPHLAPDLKRSVREYLRNEFEEAPPFSVEGFYELREGAAREFFAVPPEYRTRAGSDPRPHPFGGTHAAVRWANACGEWDRVLEAYPELKESYVSFVKTNWKLDGSKGDLYANRYISSLLAFAEIAAKAGERELAEEARTRADSNLEALVFWWKRAADTGTLRSFKDVSELDPFIGRGEGFSFQVGAHRHKIALFRDLTPQIAMHVRAEARDAVEAIWGMFHVLYRTWALQGEERQVHFGENYIDPPDLALGGFKAMVWLAPNTTAEELRAAVDLPICRADLYHIQKCGMALGAR